MLSTFLGLLAPPVCVACRHPTDRDVLCGDCRRALPWLGEEMCRRCGLPGRCMSCPAMALAFERAWAPMAYEGPVRDLVRALKERGALAVAGVMAAQMAATAPDGLLGGGVLVPVPADPVRRRRRGLDHARRLAAELSQRTHLPTASVLARRPGARQAGSDRGARWDRDRLRVELRRGAAVPEVAILVDDVHTTGATLHACAERLREAGTREVVAATYGRTLP